MDQTLLLSLLTVQRMPQHSSVAAYFPVAIDRNYLRSRLILCTKNILFPVGFTPANAVSIPLHALDDLPTVHLFPYLTLRAFCPKYCAQKHLASHARCTLSVPVFSGHADHLNHLDNTSSVWRDFCVRLLSRHLCVPIFPFLSLPNAPYCPSETFLVFRKT